MMESINQTILTFLNMKSEDRIAFIERYEFLLPYQTTALLQCKKYMNSDEKKALKKAQEKLKAKRAEEQPPQPM